VTLRLHLPRALLALLVAWAAYGCALELYRSGWLIVNDPWPEEKPSTWRVGSAPVERLEDFTSKLEDALEPGAVVAVSSPEPRREQEVRALFFAYAMPAQEVRAGRPGDGLPADYWIAYGTRLEGLEVVAEHPGGVLYRAAPEPGG